MKLRISASLDVSAVPPRLRAVAVAALVIAGLIAIASLGGILRGEPYARETSLWRTQAIGQDWANLTVAVPWLGITAVLVYRGARRARLLLGGGLLYAAYAYATYAFAVHFNTLFLIYCAVLGTSTCAFAGLISELGDVRRWFAPDAPARLAAGFEMACAGGFALLWLSQITTALVTSTEPAGLAAAGLATNPIHVLDLSLVLPAMFLGGWQLWHRRSLGYVLVPIFLGFGALMASCLTAIATAMYVAQPASGVAPVIGFAAFSLVEIALLISLFRSPRRRRGGGARFATTGAANRPGGTARSRARGGRGIHRARRRGEADVR